MKITLLERAWENVVTIKMLELLSWFVLLVDDIIKMKKP